MPAAAAAAASRALELVETEPDRREHLRSLAALLRADLERLGHDLAAGSGPIVPLIVGDSTKAVQAAIFLRAAGSLVPAIRPPTVPAGSARLRVSLTAGHQTADLAHLTTSLKFVLSELRSSI